MKYNLSKLMKRAWHYFKQAAAKTAITFSEALKKAWRWIKAQDANNAKIEAAAEAAGIEEEFHSWAGWKALGRQVIHTEKAVFQVVVDTPEKGEGKTYRKSFFLYSQTQPAPMAE